MKPAPPRSPALERLAEFLAEHDPECRELDLDAVKKTYHRTSVGAAWNVRIAPGTDDRRIDILGHIDHPFERPDVGIADLAIEQRPLMGVYTNDTLCLDSPDEPLPISNDDSMIVEILARARSRMVIAQPDDIVEPRQLEFDSYWSNRSGGVPRSISLLDDRGPSREIVYAEYPSGTYVAESRDDLTKWLVQSGKQKPNFVRRTVLIDLGECPKRAPSTNEELLTVVTSDGNAESIALLESVALAVDVPIPVILRVPTPDGTVLVTAWCDDPRVPRGKKKTVSLKWHGFLRGKAPLAQIVPRFFTASGHLRRGRVQRVDPEWLFSRGGNLLAPSLLAATVAIIGAGSLGAAVARKLVKSGVGGLLIIDPDTLSWDNIARHELGARSVTKSKAEAMTETLRADFPHIKVTAHDSRWEDVWRSEPDVLKNVDLIISTTADTGSELHLNLLARTEQLPRILFAWLEDRAGAAQALLVGGTGGCLGCGMSKFGIFSERVIYHPNRTLRRAPGCDEFYQPYSALEAEAAIAMIVEVAIDALASGSQRSRLTTWIGAKELIESDGGVIREEWVALRGDPGGGRIKISKDWNIEPTCPLCGSS